MNHSSTFEIHSNERPDIHRHSYLTSPSVYKLKRGLLRLPQALSAKRFRVTLGYCRIVVRKLVIDNRYRSKIGSLRYNSIIICFLCIEHCCELLHNFTVYRRSGNFRRSNIFIDDPYRRRLNTRNVLNTYVCRPIPNVSLVTEITVSSSESDALP